MHRIRWNTILLVKIVLSFQMISHMICSFPILNRSARTLPSLQQSFSDVRPNSSFQLRHISQNHQQRNGRRIRSVASLSMFLPPGEDDSKSSELRELTTAILTFVGIIAFFVSPLGGIFFALFNSFVALVVLLPIGTIAAINVWQYFSTITGSCPNCGVEIKVLKDESPSICFNCGSIVQAKNGQIFLANANNGRMNDRTTTNVFSTWMDQLSNTRTSQLLDDSDNNPRSVRRGNRSSKNTIIDVDGTSVDD
jgi:hypothetical protein